MSDVLPSAITPSGWDAVTENDAALQDGVRAILKRHGFNAEPVTRYDSGSLPVYAVGEHHVLKLYPPDDTEHAAVEARTLAFVHGRLPVPTPEVVATGMLDGWHYLLMSQLPGRRLVDVWPDLAVDDRDGLADELGRCVAALHGLDTASLAMPPPEWNDFARRQRESARARQQARALAPQWVAQIDPFLDTWMPNSPRRALLHTEIMREHLTVARGADGWHLTGLFDFEPAMVGDPEYDFASIGLFVSCGDGRFLRRTLCAYGYRKADLDTALPCRLMAHALLHRYSNLRWYLERLPPAGETTLAQLAARWWSLTPRQ